MKSRNPKYSKTIWPWGSRNCKGGQFWMLVTTLGLFFFEEVKQMDREGIIRHHHSEVIGNNNEKPACSFSLEYCGSTCTCSRLVT